MIDVNLEWYIDQKFRDLCHAAEHKEENSSTLFYAYGAYKTLMGAAYLVNAVGSPEYDYLCKAGNAVFETVLPEDIREVL